MTNLNDFAREAHAVTIDDDHDYQEIIAMIHSERSERLSRLTHEPQHGCYEDMRNTAYVKDKEVYLKGCGYGGEDITLYRYCAEQCRERCGIDLSEVTTEDFYDHMNCPVCVLYMVAVGAAGMREKAFEDEEERSQQNEEPQ